jgi:hypothetical protein
MMLLQQALGVKEDAFLIENSFESLEVDARSIDYLGQLTKLPKEAVKAAIAISDKNGEPLAISFRNTHPEGDFWLVIPYPRTPASRQQTEKMANKVLSSGVVASLKKKKMDSKKLDAAIRECLSISLAGGALCDCVIEKEPLSFAVNDSRNVRIRKLMKQLASENGYDLKKIDALEICCGNGMSTAAISPLFKSVLAMDNDRCAVCNGLFYEILDPADTMVADAMQLSKYLHVKYGAVVGFMLGTIYEFNKELWRTIFAESIKVLDEGGFLLLTVNKKEEIDFLAEAFKAMGVEGIVIDNRDEESIYDGWVFYARRQVSNT